MLKVKFNRPTQYGNRQFDRGIVYEVEKNELPPRADRYEVIGKAKVEKPIVRKQVQPKPISKVQAKAMKPKQVKNTAMVAEEVTTKSDEDVQVPAVVPQEDEKETVQVEE